MPTTLARRARARVPHRRYKRRFRKHVPRALATRSTGFLRTKQKVFTNLTLPLLLVSANTLMVFDISLLPNIVEFQKLFDQYRITGVKVDFLQTTQNEPSNPGMVMATSIDLDGGTVPATFDLMLQRSNCQVRPWSSAGGGLPRRSVFLRPRFANEIYRTGVTSATSLGNPKSWLDTSDVDIPHYGLNIAWNNTTGSLNYTAQVAVTLTYYLEFRKVK